MSQRVYAGPRADRGGPGGAARALPWVAFAVLVALQVAYPLTHGSARELVTVAAVVAGAAAALSHAAVWRGLGWAAVFAVLTVGGGFAIEYVGVHTGHPFGAYHYTATLGQRVAGVPWVVPLAWTMMAYPSLVAARTLCRSAWLTPPLAALALASWDLFLDPMMTGDHRWVFAHPTPALPAVPGTPLTNYAGWALAALALMVLVDRLPRHPAPDAQPHAVYLWTYASSVLNAAVFAHRPYVAVYGGVAMGLVAVPLVVTLWWQRD